jgi:hypothetical protein
MIRRCRLATQLLFVAVITLVPLHEDPKRPHGSVEDNPCPAYSISASYILRRANTWSRADLLPLDQPFW